MKTEPANEQEMSVYLAKNVVPKYDILVSGCYVLIINAPRFEIENFIYSPDGLISVIERLVEDLPNFPSSIAKAWENFLFTRDYDAFYKAVWQALEGKWLRQDNTY